MVEVKKSNPVWEKRGELAEQPEIFESRRYLAIVDLDSLEGPPYFTR